MKKSFMCSLICHNGIVGGALYLDENSVTYKTNKLTVDRAYRNLVLPLNQIAELTWKWIVFPVAIFRMKNGEKYGNGSHRVEMDGGVGAVKLRFSE